MSFLATPGAGSFLNKKTGIFDKIGSFLFGSKDKTKQLPTLTPQQQQTLSTVLSQLGLMGGPGGNYAGAQNYLGQMISGSPEAYQRFAAPYQTQFQEQTLPGIAERFAGLGGGLGGGALSSSGFGQALGGAANQFQSNLAGLYAQLQQQAAGQALGQYNQLANLGLGTRGFENIYQPGSTGLFGGAASGLSQGLGQAAGMRSMTSLLPLMGL